MDVIWRRHAPSAVDARATFPAAGILVFVQFAPEIVGPALAAVPSRDERDPVAACRRTQPYN